MPKNTKGGKKGRRGKNEVEERYFEEKTHGQAYALVTQYFGNGRVEVNCFIERAQSQPKSENDEETKDSQEFTRNDGVEKEFDSEKKLGIIRGSIRKKKYKNNVTVGCLVIVGLRDFEKDKCDILHVYNNDEVRKLRKQGDIPSVAVSTELTESVAEGVEFCDEFSDEDNEIDNI